MPAQAGPELVSRKKRIVDDTNLGGKSGMRQRPRPYCARWAARCLARLQRNRYGGVRNPIGKIDRSIDRVDKPANSASTEVPETPSSPRTAT